MLAARDNKHNIVEKLLELGAVVTDRDKVRFFGNAFLPTEFIFLIIYERRQLSCRFVSFFI